MDDKGTDKFLKYLEDAVRYDEGVAPFELCYDSQAQWVVGKLKAQEFDEASLLDYGCGNLRLLNAIHKAGLLSRIRCIGSDISSPVVPSTETIPFDFKMPQDLKRLPVASFDVAVIMNVIHEVSISDFSDIVETIRRLLKPSGRLLLVDMAILPEGEYRALPYYPWELESIFFECCDCSYTSRSGVPVVALEIPASSIPVYKQFERNLLKLIQEKRDFYSELACSLSSRDSNPRINELLGRFSLNHGDAHDLGYLMLMSGFANFKLIEHKAMPRSSHDEISDAAEAILRWFFDYWEEKNELPRYFSALNALGGDHPYTALTDAMSHMSGHVGSFFMPMTNENFGLQKLTPSESLDVFEDRYDYSAIQKLGLGKLQEECHRVMWPDG